MASSQHDSSREIEIDQINSLFKGSTMHRRGIQESDDEEDETYNDVVPESPSSCEDSKIQGRLKKIMGPWAK
ncbi:hypothetical protein YC2023_052140 [Brassica napus]